MWAIRLRRRSGLLRTEPSYGVSARWEPAAIAKWLFLAPFILWAAWLWVSLPVKGLAQ